MRHNARALERARSILGSTHDAPSDVFARPPVWPRPFQKERFSSVDRECVDRHQGLIGRGLWFRHVGELHHDLQITGRDQSLHLPLLELLDLKVEEQRSKEQACAQRDPPQPNLAQYKSLPTLHYRKKRYA
jgi:hypothetical protein